MAIQDDPSLLDALAAKYALGILRGRARRRFEAVQRQSSAARAAVAAWEARLHKLAVAVSPVRPPARVWTAIEARVHSAQAPLPSGAPVLDRLLDGMRAWLAPALGVALGAVLALTLVQLAPDAFVSIDRIAEHEQALPQSYVGLLTDGDNVPHLLVSSTRRGTRLTLKSLRAWQVPPGKVAQVWALPRDPSGNALQPIPLGVAQPATPPGSTTFELTAPSEHLLSNVQRLMVTFEDRAARTGDTPSTPVFAGFCVKLW